MKQTNTFAIIKPDAVRSGYSGEIIKMIEAAGFTIKAAKLIKITPEQAAQFYSVHKEKPFYDELIKYISSSAIFPLVLVKKNAVDDFRLLIGATDPMKAELGTIRKLYAKSISENAIHGSDSDQNAKTEISFFFSKTEQY